MAKVDLDEAAWSAGYAAGLVGKSKPCPYRKRCVATLAAGWRFQAMAAGCHRQGVS
jgi:ribosome modulation factor